ncbi:Hsp33 family molecular chaperone [Roseibium aestuarii]|uniref:Hsp33 family molecular chaperone n=1 Tax=Roseibium aestuarii TaxID=2600299 RepID=A0ABW4JSP6_9HYPH|nr:Hsp33 family molecular chaperone [Roseibium aestuarii]
MAFDLKDFGVEPAGFDAVRPFAVEGLDVRGRALVMGPVIDNILSRHDYPAPVSRLLAEAVVLTSLLGTALKFEGRFTLQTQSDGPVSMLVVDFSAPESVRAYASFDAEQVADAMARGATRPEDLLGRGHLAMTIDQGQHMQRYQGLVELDGASLEEIAHRYFARSEQIPTVVRLAVGELLTPAAAAGSTHRWIAGGVMVQFLPDSTERMRQADIHPGDAPEGTEAHVIDEDDAWLEAKALVDTIKDDELVDPDLGVEHLLFRLFHERGARLFEPQKVQDRCRCSRERVEGILSTFKAEEVDAMREGDKIVVTCEFCSTRYEFDADNF